MDRALGFNATAKIAIFSVFAKNRKNRKVGGFFETQLRKLRKIARLTVFRVICDQNLSSLLQCSL